MTEPTNPFARPRGTMNVYLCGGTGVNIAKDAEALKKSVAARGLVKRIDTSKAGDDGMVL